MAPAATPERPLGEPVDFTTARRPEPAILRGQHIELRPIEPDRDAAPLYAATHAPTGDPGIWTYMYEGPYASVDELRGDLERQSRSNDPLYFTLIPLPGDMPRGIVSYLAIVPEHGTIEIGNIWFARELQRTVAATEAIFVLARHAFDDLGYRRLEWKCNSLNAPSRRAAERFGFRFEGIFVQHRVVKGRNRDTAWFAITDVRWPAIRAAFEAWLDPANFDERWVQRSSLQELTRGA
jgi:RimJ/RimL family protein N-acetyltransferase